MRIAASVVTCVVVASVVCGAVGSAAAEKDPKKRAVKLIDQGDKLFQKKDYEGALAKYQQAYQIFPSPKIYYAMAKAEEKLNRPLEAVAHYEQFVAEVVEDVNEDLRIDAQVSVQELDKTVAVVTFAVQPEGATITIDDVELGTSPYGKPVRLLPGPHKYTFAKEGFVPIEKTVELAAGDKPAETVTLAANLPAEPEPEIMPPPAPVRPAGKPAYEKTVLWTGVGVTGALALGWLVTGALAVSDHGDFSDTGLGGDDRASARDSGKTMALTSDLLLVSALAAGGFTAYWYFKVYRTPEQPVAAPPVREQGAPPVPGGDDDGDAPPGMSGAVFLPYVAPGAAGVAIMGTF